MAELPSVITPYAVDKETHPLIGEQLVIFQQMEWTTEITGEFHCKTWIWLWIIKKGITAFFLSMSMSVVMSAQTVQFGASTVLH